MVLVVVVRELVPAELEAGTEVAFVVPSLAALEAEDVGLEAVVVPSGLAVEAGAGVS